MVVVVDFMEIDMRFKFRAWNKEDKEMIYSGKHLWNFFMDYEEFMQEPLMQYTGLKDKNGVEIYESDIVTRADSKKGVVDFGRHLFDGTARASQGYYFGDGYTLDGTLEVIGNIYENPELLENNNE